MERFEWSEPTSVEAAVRELSATRVVKAGGIDLLDLMKEGFMTPERLVSLRRVPGLDQIEDALDSLRIGARVSLATLAASGPVQQHAGALAEAAEHAATPQIRNMATLGGNLLQRPRCWYFRSSDFICKKNGGQTCYAQNGRNEFHAVFGNLTCAMVHPSTPATALLAMQASVELTGPNGTRTVSLDEFFVSPDQDLKTETVRSPDELLVAVTVPKAKGRKTGYIKQTHKQSFDWPIADVAVALDMDGRRCRAARVVLGAAAPTPYRAQEAEGRLKGKIIDEAVAQHAADGALAGAQPLEHNGYKLAVFRAVVRRTIMKAVG